MKKQRPVLWTAITLMIAAYLIFMPERLFMRERAAVEEKVYTGIIDVWHIVTFKPYQGSVGTVLGEAARRVEKANKGIYFEITAMTELEYEARLQRGNEPDAISFAAGSLYPEKLRAMADIELPEGAFSDCGLFGGETLAAAYGASGSCLLVNRTMAAEAGVSVPEDITDEWMQRAADAIGVCGDEVTWAQLGIQGDCDAKEAFSAATRGMAAVDWRFMGDILNSGAISTEVLPVDGYTGLVYLLAPAKNISDEELSYVTLLANELLTERFQKRLAGLGLMPVLRVKDADYPSAVESVLPDMTQLRVPNAFALQRHYDALASAAGAYMNGAENDFADRLPLLFEPLE